MQPPRPPLMQGACPRAAGKGTKLRRARALTRHCLRQTAFVRLLSDFAMSLPHSRASACAGFMPTPSGSYGASYGSASAAGALYGHLLSGGAGGGVVNVAGGGMSVPARFASRPQSAPSGATPQPPRWLTDLLSAGSGGAGGDDVNVSPSGDAATPAPPSGGFRPYALSGGAGSAQRGSGSEPAQNTSSGDGGGGSAGGKAPISFGSGGGIIGADGFAVPGSPAALAALAARRGGRPSAPQALGAATSDAATSARAHGIAHAPLAFVGGLGGFGGLGALAGAHHNPMRRINSTEMSAVIGLVSAAWTGWGAPGSGHAAAAAAGAAAAAAGVRR
jgi:hypothetical protein